MTYLANAGTIIENGTTYSLPAGGDANLSATDFFGLEIQVQTFKRAQQNELGWNPAISTRTNSPHWRQHFYRDRGRRDPGVTKVSGVFVSGLNENAVRVVAPQTLPAPDLNAFAWPQNYVPMS